MKKIFIAGFGGQGILFTGKFIAYAAMLEGKEVTWLPAYGAESRGGTSNCHVIISEKPIGSPVVQSPDVLICMNLPSLDKFEKNLAQGGALYIDDSMVTRKTSREDVKTHYVPATKLAFDNSLDGLANMIMLGAAIRESGLCSREIITETMGKVISERKKEMYENNLKAVNIGLEFKEGEN